MSTIDKNTLGYRNRRTTVPAVLVSLLLALLAGGCAVSAIEVAPEDIQTPATWARSGGAGSVTSNWLTPFSDSRLEQLVAESVASNFALKQERQRFNAARQSVKVTRSSRLPSFDLALDGSRRGTEDTAGNRVTTETFGLDVDGRIEIDLWMKLSNAQQAAALSLAAQEARLVSTERGVAVTTARQYFDVLEATLLFDVARRRLEVAVSSHDIVASGYRQGLNEALDLYLARDQIERERANVAQQEQNRLEAVAALQLSLARYPDGDIGIEGELPVPTASIPTGLPSELLGRRPDIQEAWLSLLAADAELAVAHKARFPSLSLVGSTGTSSSEFSDLLSDGSSGWSLAFGLTQPLFAGGRLAAVEEQKRLAVRIAEQNWLDVVYRAFADVENAISRSASLDERYDALLEAEKNSRAALELALDQYGRGLVSYTTVLVSQRQAFDAAATVVQLKNQRLQNRLTLNLALGGDFAVVN
ncbi:MAG: TolC family protein [Gammaproteobacteria bacterium]|nr:TolC family protein [Gammaproteobacteria bacterium]